MVDFSSIERRDRSPCYFLVVAGVDTCFGSVLPPEKTYFVTNEASGYRIYDRSVSIIPGRGFDFSRSLEEEDAIIESDPVSVHLVCRDHIDPTDTTDPGYIFGRMGFSGADFSAQLTQSIDLSDTPTVHLTTSEGLVVGDMVHIGSECIEVGAVDFNAKTFTVAALGRGRLGTTRARHAVSPDDGVFPLVTKPAVFFRGRRAVIYEAALGVNGGLPDDSDWIERFRGFLATEPEFATDGGLETVTLSISPMTASLDRPLSHRSGKLRLHPRLHSFDGRSQERLVFFETVEDGRYMNLSITGQQVIGGETYTTLTQGTAQALDGLLPYPDNPDTVELYPYKQPRRFVTHIGIQGGGTAYAVILDRDGDNVLLRDVDGPLRNDGDNFVGEQGSIFGNFSHVEIRVLRLGQTAGADFNSGTPGTALWPDVISHALTNQGFDSSQLFNGLFQILFSPQSRTFSFIPNYKYTIPNAAQLAAIQVALPRPPKASIVLDRDPDHKWDLLRDAARGTHGWMGALMRGDEFMGSSNQANEYDNALAFSGGEQVNNRIIDFGWGDADRDLTLECAYDPTPTIAASQSRAAIGRSVKAIIPSAFFHPGPRFNPAPCGFWGPESYITLDKDPGVPVGGSVILSASIGDGDAFMHVVIGPAVSVTASGETGYRCPVLDGTFLSDEMDVIRDFGGPVSERPLFSPTVRFAPTLSVGEMILQLLCSSSGGGVTSADYDVLPLGAGLRDHTDLSDNPLGADVDGNSFLAITEPAGLNFSPVFRSGDTILDVMRGVLLSVGYVLDMRIDDTGHCKLSAVKVGVPSALDVVGLITDSDMAETPIPSSPARTAIRNIFHFSSNFDASGDPAFEQEIKDTASIEAFGEADKLDVELQGAVLNLDPGSVLAVLQPVFSKLRLEMAFPYRLYRFAVRAGLAARMKVGGVYQITSGQLRGARGPGGVEAICRLRSIESAGFEPTAKVEFIHFGFAGTGWAPSLAVTGANGAVLTVRTDDYRPSTADEDLSGFEGISAGSTVRLFVGNNPGAGSSHGVVGVDLAANTITLAVDPGLAAPGDGHEVWAYITPDVRDDVAAIHDDYGFMGTVKLT